MAQRRLLDDPGTPRIDTPFGLRDEFDLNPSTIEVGKGTMEDNEEGICQFDNDAGSRRTVRQWLHDAVRRDPDARRSTFAPCGWNEIRDSLLDNFTRLGVVHRPWSPR